MRSGIYQIKCKITGERYIGSSKNINERWSDHKKECRGQYHNNAHLQNAWNKYEERNFIFEILEETEQHEDVLLSREQYYIDEYKPEYNICKIAGRPPLRFHTDEEKKNLSLMNSGERNGFFGRKHSDVTREKMRKNSKHIHGEDHYFFGKKHSKETKEKISDSRKNNEMCSGENNVNTHLKWEDIISIREKYIPNIYSIGMLAKEYNVSKTCIRYIIHEKTWKNIPVRFVKE